MRGIDQGSRIHQLRIMFVMHEVHIVNTPCMLLLSDPLGAAYMVCSRCAPHALQTLYGVGEFSNPDQFLALVSVARGKIGKGGVPNLEAAARIILHDWNSGKISYYTTPPE